MHHQDIYYDGHEHDDVVAYRKIFLKKMVKFEQYMATYEGDSMECILPVLKEGEKEYILVTHDECIFYANDGSRGIWIEDGMFPLKKRVIEDLL